MKEWVKKDIERFKKEREKIVKTAYQDAKKFKKDWQPEFTKEDEEE
ncbi:hypothetical protein [Cytophaga sp. FL35]|nr:hypothetical protein [Cytophaga sp. FL35]MBC7000796.1 hypothetical protein [Cytophaga sp. FL35]